MTPYYDRAKGARLERAVARADRIAEMTARYSLTIQGPSWRSS